ncbi:MAG: hypothetical protein MZV63_06860 [Marinilabiliales bacterium]|nr:hypothetical protein [Marinilabiliales bacterium]
MEDPIIDAVAQSTAADHGGQQHVLAHRRCARTPRRGRIRRRRHRVGDRKLCRVGWEAWALTRSWRSGRTRTTCARQSKRLIVMWERV